MAHETMDTTKDQARQVAGTAADESRSLAGSAQEQAQQVAQTAMEQLADVAGEAQHQASELASQATTQVRQQADAQTQRAAELLRDYDSELQALLEGRPQDAPHLVERLQQASGRLSSVADNLERRGAQGLIDDVEDFARRRPGLFLAGAALAGFAFTRILRSSRQTQQLERPQQLPAAPSPGATTPPATTDITETAERPLAPSTGPGQEVIEVHPDGRITSPQGG